MNRHAIRVVAAAGALLFVMSASSSAQGKWPPKSMDRPQPPIVNPGPERPPVPPPSDAIVLFDGKSLSSWETDSGKPAAWAVRDGYMEIVPGSGEIVTKRKMGDVQLHIEWASPTPAEGESQERGNSGVFLMRHYEIQVLDNYRNLTYADGMAASVYGQSPPLVNASRGPGQWQTYDIVFRRPHFDAKGGVTRPARVTVLHNGVLVQDNTEITGWTVDGAVARYKPHADKLPLALQDHGRKVRYRDIWVRELHEAE